MWVGNRRTGRNKGQHWDRQNRKLQLELRKEKENETVVRKRAWNENHRACIAVDDVGVADSDECWSC